MQAGGRRFDPGWLHCFKLLVPNNLNTVLFARNSADFDAFFVPGRKMKNRLPEICRRAVRNLCLSYSAGEQSLSRKIRFAGVLRRVRTRDRRVFDRAVVENAIFTFQTANNRRGAASNQVLVARLPTSPNGTEPLYRERLESNENGSDASRSTMRANVGADASRAQHYYIAPLLHAVKLAFHAQPRSKTSTPSAPTLLLSVIRRHYNKSDRQRFTMRQRNFHVDDA